MAESRKRLIYFRTYLAYLLGLLPAPRVLAHIIQDAPGEALWQATSDHLDAVNQQMPGFIEIGGIVVAGWYFLALITLPFVALNLWKHKADKRMWVFTAIAAATAWATSYAITPLIRGDVNTIETADKQFAVFIGYYSALTFTWLSGWLMLAVNKYFGNVTLGRICISMLVVSVVLLWILSRFQYITPLSQMWRA